MRRVHFLLFIALVLYSVAGVNAQQKERKAPPPPPPAPTQHELYAPYWTLEPGWHTELELRNNTPEALTVTPVVRTAAGTEVPLSPVTVASNDVSMVDLHAALMQSAPNLVDKVGAYGSVALRYKSAFLKNIYAGSMVHYEGKPIAFHFDGVGAEELFNEGTRESLWWLPTDTADGHVIITDASSKPAECNVTIFGANGKAYSQQLHLQPRETRRYSIRELVNSFGIKSQMGGLRISVARGSESVLVAHIAFDTASGFAALMKTFEDSPNEPPGVVNLRAPMLALSTPDPALTFPEGTLLHPRIYLRNAHSGSLDVTGELHWRGATASGLLPLPSTTLAPNETRTIDVGALQQAGTVPADAYWAYVKLNYNGRYGDLVAIATSYDNDLTHGTQTPFTDIAASHWIGSQWYADPLRHSLITAGNASDKAVNVLFSLFYNRGQGRYEIERELAPGEQMFVDVAKIIQEQIPDKNGVPIPSGVTSGSYSIHDKNHASGPNLFEGKLTIDKTFGYASYGCANCCEPTASILTPGGFSENVGSGWQYTLGGYAECDNSYWDVTSDATWSSLDSSIVSVDWTAHASAVAPGQTTVYADIHTTKPVYRCPIVLREFQSSGSVKPTVSVQGLDYVYIGHDPQVISFNGFFGQGVPTGGTYTWSTTDQNVSFNDIHAATARITATSYSGQNGGTPLTLNYSKNGISANPFSVSVTKRIFKYLQQYGSTIYAPCSGCYGYTATLQYNVFSQPNSQIVTPGGLNGTVVDENVSTTSFTINGVPTNPIGTLITGAGALDDNSQATDHLGIHNGSQLPDGLDWTLDQDLFVGGIYVRNNTLHLLTTTITVTNNGPTN